MSIVQLCFEARRAAIAAGLLVWAMPQAFGHDRRLGDVVFDHPYAVPSPAGATTAGVYFRGVHLVGTRPERIVAATSTAATRVVLLAPPQDGPAAPTAASGIDLKPGVEIKTRHDSPALFTLIGLQRPLHAGESFELTVKLERAGRGSFVVTVVQPRDPQGSVHGH